MIILSFDASQPVIEICLRQNGQTLELLQEKLSQIEHLPKLSSELLLRHGLEPGKIDRLGLVRGPGSYTGLRGSILLAKTFAFSLGTPLVSRLRTELMLYTCQELARPVLAVQSVRQQQFFAALGLYQSEAFNYLISPQIVDQKTLLAWQSEHKCPVIGDWTFEQKNPVKILSSEKMTSRLAEWTEKIAQVDTAESLEPFYIRPALV